MATRGVQLTPKCPAGTTGVPPNCERIVKPTCPAGTSGTYPNCNPSHKSAGVSAPGTGKVPASIPGRGAPAPAPAAGGGGMSMTLPSMGGGMAGGWQPSGVERPNLTPIDPQANYDPEMQAELASRRGYTQDLKQGTGFAEDVRVQSARDTSESELQQAKAAALAQGIPFDEAEFRTRQAQGANKVGADVALERERMVGESLGASAGQAGSMASERDTRKELDLRRDVSENELALDRYGKDITKYSADAAAATAANNQLMDFYTKLTSGLFSTVGNLANVGGSFSTNTRFG